MGGECHRLRTVAVGRRLGWKGRMRMEGTGGPAQGRLPDDPGLTRILRADRDPETELDSHTILLRVYRALQEKGYDPIGQISQYLLSGEPTYITGHQNARALMTRLERDEVIAELVRAFIAQLTGEEPARRRA